MFWCAGVDQWMHNVWKLWLEMEFVRLFPLMFAAFHCCDVIETNVRTETTIQHLEMVHGHCVFDTIPVCGKVNTFSPAPFSKF
jgi:hypothetical protein